jgi:uncharacterized membrane protein YadS
MSDKPKKEFHVFFKSEDYWAIWLGAAILLFALFIFVGNAPANMESIIEKSNATMQVESEKAPFKTIAWHEASTAKNALNSGNTPIAREISSYFVRVGNWNFGNPMRAFYLSKEDADARNASNAKRHEDAKAATVAAKTAAADAEKAAAAAQFSNTALNDTATEKIAAWQSARSAESRARTAASTREFNHFPKLLALMVIFGLFFCVGRYFIEAGDTSAPIKFLMAFPAVFFVAVLSFFLSTHDTSRAWGLEYVLWAIMIGFLVSNTVGTPKWIMPAVQTEYYIKTGLVLLGATILMSKILLIGIPGIFLTWVVTPIVLCLTFWFGQHVLKMESKTLNIVVSADMSVSGVSAAIAAAAASRAKKEELTLAVGISILFTAIMMVVMPMGIKASGMHPVLGGAWLGSTLDSTGAVVAAGAVLGDTARDVAATVKMIQNMIIGLMAFCIAAYWALKVDVSRASETDMSFKGAMKEIWNRFPKFCLGFIGASVAFSIIYSSMTPDVANVTIDKGTSSFLGNLQRWLFALAFASIGLSTNFRELKQYFKGGKALTLYLSGQTFNVIFSFFVAYVLFMVIFTDITAKLMK